MKSFIIKTALFAVIWLSLAYALQWVTDRGLRQSNLSTEYKEWHDIVNSKINADIIIQGSSKAAHQISPLAFENELKKSTYNLGMEGHVFPMQKWRSEVYFRYNKKPDHIIQILGLTEFSNPVINYNYIQFIPYLNEGFIEKFGGNSYLDYKDFYIPLYKYSRKTGMMENGLISYFTGHQPTNKKYKGFHARNAAWSDTALLNVKKKYPKGIVAEIHEVAHQAFTDHIIYCKKNNINLVLVYPPTHNSFQNIVTNRHEIMKYYYKMAEKHSLKLLDYSKDTICDDTSMFYNFNHLNTKGVLAFNKKLINDLKDHIK